MYLTRIVLDLLDIKTIETIASPHKTHALVESLFLPYNKKERPRNLWRIDQDSEKCNLLIVSPLPPSIHQENPLSIAAISVDTIDYKPYINSIRVGETLQFRFKASPTKRIYQKDENGENLKNAKGFDLRGRVTPIRGQEQQKEWLLERSQTLGSEINPSSIKVLRVGTEVFQKKSDKNCISMATALFEGELKVVDVERIKKVLFSGYARNKAHGCGMLSVWRPQKS